MDDQLKRHLAGPVCVRCTGTTSAVRELPIGASWSTVAVAKRQQRRSHDLRHSAVMDDEQRCGVPLAAVAGEPRGLLAQRVSEWPKHCPTAALPRDIWLNRAKSRSPRGGLENRYVSHFHGAWARPQQPALARRSERIDGQAGDDGLGRAFGLTCPGSRARSPQGASVPTPKASWHRSNWPRSEFLATFWRPESPNLALLSQIYGTEGHRFESCRARSRSLAESPVVAGDRRVRGRLGEPRRVTTGVTTAGWD
jgi:hypothetical protein